MSVTLGDGQYNLNAFASDSFQQSSQSNIVPITVDTAAPRVNSTDPTGNATGVVVIRLFRLFFNGEIDPTTVESPATSFILEDDQGAQ